MVWRAAVDFLLESKQQPEPWSALPRWGPAVSRQGTHPPRAGALRRTRALRTECHVDWPHPGCRASVARASSSGDTSSSRRPPSATDAAPGPPAGPKAAPVIYLRLNPAHAPQASTHPGPGLDPALGCRATDSSRQQRTGWTCGQGRQRVLRHFPLSLAHPTTASASRMWKLRHRAAQSAPKDTRLVPGRAGVWTGPRCSSSSFCRCPEGCLVQSGQVGSSREAHGADLGAEPSHRLGRPA